MTGKANIRDPRKRKAKELSRNSNINFNQGRGSNYTNSAARYTHQVGVNATQDINMNTYDIINLDRMLFATEVGSGDTIDVTEYGIESISTGAAAYGLKFQIPSGKIHTFNVGTVGALIISGTSVISTVDVTTANINLGSHKIKYQEISTPSPNPNANEGFMYSKDVSGVTTPMWLDSAGTETSLLGGGSSGADQDLNNLTTTSINQSLLPSSTNSKSLGSASLQWQNLFIDGIARIDSLGFGASYSMTLPTTLGTNGQVLTTNGSSALSWTTVSGSGGFPSPVNTNLDMNDNDILGVNLLDFDGTTTEIRGLTNLNFYHTDRQITSTGSYAGLSHTVASSEKHGFLIGGSTKMEVSSDLEMSIDIDMNDNDVLGVDQLSFSVSGQYMTGNSSGVNYYVPTGDSHKLYVGTTKIADLGAGSWDSTVALYMGNNKIRNLDEPTSNDDAATKYYVDQNSGGGSSGANTTLSNLGTTVINASLNPSSTSSIDLGSSSKKWRYIYAVQLVGAAVTATSLGMSGDIDMNNNEILDSGEIGMVADIDMNNNDIRQIKTANIEENYNAGFAPTGVTNTAILFTRPSSSGKTELRVRFQSGNSILLAIEA